MLIVWSANLVRTLIHTQYLGNHFYPVQETNQCVSKAVNNQRIHCKREDVLTRFLSWDGHCFNVLLTKHQASCSGRSVCRCASCTQFIGATVPPDVRTCFLLYYICETTTLECVRILLIIFVPSGQWPLTCFFMVSAPFLKPSQHLQKMFLKALSWSHGAKMQC